MTTSAFRAGSVKRSIGPSRVERLKFSAPAIVSALGLDLKERGGRLRGNCPWRPDSNSGAFSLDLATGGWNDFARDEHGDVFDLVARALNLADRAADRFPEVLAEAEALAGLRSFSPDAASAAPSLEILERRRREREAAAARTLDDGRINGPWRRFSDAQAEERFGFLARALDAGDRSFFAEVYSIPELPEAPAAVAPFRYPSAIQEIDPNGSAESREGYLYAARDERGALEALKFKTRARTLSRGKRASRGVWGAKAALLGAELLPLAEGGTVIVTAGEEKALAGNAWALRTGAPFVFVASLFGEGFHHAHGPAQARRIVEAGPARIVLAGDADAAGAKFNAAWRAGLIHAGMDPKWIGAVEWPEGAPAGFDVNDALAAAGADALFARIANAPAMPAPATAPEAPATRPRGKGLRARIALPPSQVYALPTVPRRPLRAIRHELRQRLESLPEGGKLLVAAGTGTGKTFAAAQAVARELERRTRPGEPLPRVLIAAETNLWPDWRGALEGAGIAPGRIAELKGRDCSTCQLSALANELRAKNQNVARELCGRGMKSPETGEKAKGGESWTPCGKRTLAEGREPGCQGAEGQTGYVHLYETARRAAVVVTTPERLFGPGFGRLEAGWPFGLLIVDEGVDRHLLPSRSIPTAAADAWRNRLGALDTPEIPHLGAGPTWQDWFGRLQIVAAIRAAMLDADKTRRLEAGRGRADALQARVVERDAWTAWARGAWPGEPDPGALLAEEVSDLLSALRGQSDPLPFERARDLENAPHAGFRQYARALLRDLSNPDAEPWLVAEKEREKAPAWRIVEPCAEALAPLRDPARRVAVLDATPSSAARAILSEFGFESFEAQAPDETRVVQVRGLVNGTGRASADHEARLVEILEGLGADPSAAAVLTHKGRAEGFERLSVGATFGKHRGTNALAEFSSLVVDGRSEPPAEETARERRLLSRTLADLGAPEPPLHPLIALSRPDERPGLESRRRFVQFVGDPVAVSVPSSGDDAVDSWALERRERETLQCVGRLRGPDRAATGADPGLVVIVTDDPLGLVPVEAFREWSEPAEAFEAAAAGLNERRKMDAAERDADRLEALERALAEIRLGGGALSGRAISGQAGLAPRTMRRTLERLGVSFEELTGAACPEKRGALDQYKKDSSPSPEPVELVRADPSGTAGADPLAELPAALAANVASAAEREALDDPGAFEPIRARGRTPEQVPEGARARRQDAAEALAVAASSPSLAGWPPIRSARPLIRSATGPRPLGWPWPPGTSRPCPPCWTPEPRRRRPAAEAPP
jgi:hypothetical protein